MTYREKLEQIIKFDKEMATPKTIEKIKKYLFGDDACVHDMFEVDDPDFCQGTCSECWEKCADNIK